MSLCTDFIIRARWTWEWIKRATSVKIAPKEETITDLNLVELQTKHPNEIKTETFTKYEESRIGADWDWWLGSGDLWLRLGVQAKILDPQTLKYEHLDYSPKNSPKRQIDLLIYHSLNDKPPKIPVYVFYNYWDINKFDPPWLCPIYSKSIETLGCAVSEAISIKSILDQGSKTLQDIADVMYPWSCLVCCKGFSKQNERLPSIAFNFLLGAFGRYIKESAFPLYERSRFVLEKAPSYVYQILEGKRLSEEEWSKINVNRISVIYEREEKNQKQDSFVFR